MMASTVHASRILITGSTNSGTELKLAKFYSIVFHHHSPAQCESAMRSSYSDNTIPIQMVCTWQSISCYNYYHD